MCTEKEIIPKPATRMYPYYRYKGVNPEEHESMSKTSCRKGSYDLEMWMIPELRMYRRIGVEMRKRVEFSDSVL